jgi:hypothetical protein
LSVRDGDVCDMAGTSRDLSVRRVDVGKSRIGISDYMISDFRLDLRFPIYAHSQVAQKNKPRFLGKGERGFLY